MDRRERREKKDRDWLSDRTDLVDENDMFMWVFVIGFLILILGMLIGKK